VVKNGRKEKVQGYKVDQAIRLGPAAIQSDQKPYLKANCNSGEEVDANRGPLLLGNQSVAQGKSKQTDNAKTQNQGCQAGKYDQRLVRKPCHNLLYQIPGLSGHLSGGMEEWNYEFDGWW